MKTWKRLKWIILSAVGVCVVLLFSIELLFTTQTVTFKRGEQVLSESRSVRQPWNLQSFNSFIAESKRHNANQAIMIQRGFFGILWTKYSHASGSMTTDDEQDVVTITLP